MKHDRQLCALLAGALLAGCGDRQSVLNPKGPYALELTQLTWLLFGFATVVLVIVMLAVAGALWGSDRARALIGSARTVVWTGIVFPAVTLTGLLAYGIVLTRAAAVAPNDDPTALRISVSGEQWWWRVTYESESGPITAANEIRIPAGRPVLFKLSSPDVIHSFWVPSLGGKIDMIPGRTTLLRLQADEPGVYRGQCAEYCGGPHALMAFEVLVLAQAEFNRWLDVQAKPAAEPVSDTARRGRDLFLASGCGACHAVRGIPAVGTIGPDLTHLGSRRSVGVDTLPLTDANIRRFIHDGQHIKPGNRMPPFRIFSDADLDAIAKYLAHLR